jgi:hypothetical protein
MVESMKPGSVIVDLRRRARGQLRADPARRNRRPWRRSISGPLNLAGEVPVNASSLYAKNLLAFLETMIDKKAKALAVNWDDEHQGHMVAATAASSTPACNERGDDDWTRRQPNSTGPLPLRGGVRGGVSRNKRSVWMFTPPPTPPRRRVEDAPSARWEGSPVGV